MDTRFLESFVQVVELGSVAAAARQLDLTPTAVSLRLRALEADVGTALIKRVGRTMMPTVAGSKALRQAKLVLAEVKNFNSLASNTELPAGPLTLGATPSVVKGMLPGMLRKWLGKYEGTKILIEPAASTVLYQRLLQGELDAAILVHPLFEVPKTVLWKQLRKEPLILLAPARLQGEDPFSILRKYPFIRYDRRVVAGKMADDYLKLHGVYPEPWLELDGLDYISDLVKADLGVSVVPDWSYGNQYDPGLTRHRLPGPVPTRNLGIMWLRSNVREKLIHAFLALAD